MAFLSHPLSLPPLSCVCVCVWVVNPEAASEMEWSSYTFMLRARDTWYDDRDSQELGSPDGILRHGRGQMRPATVIPRRPQRRLAQEETEVNKRGT